MSHKVRCQNVAQQCWREVHLDGFHVKRESRIYCSVSCADEYKEQNDRLVRAADPFHLPLRPPRSG